MEYVEGETLRGSGRQAVRLADGQLFDKLLMRLPLQQT